MHAISRCDSHLLTADGGWTVGVADGDHVFLYLEPTRAAPSPAPVCPTRPCPSRDARTLAPRAHDTSTYNRPGFPQRPLHTASRPLRGRCPAPPHAARPPPAAPRPSDARASQARTCLCPARLLDAPLRGPDARPPCVFALSCAPLSWGPHGLQLSFFGPACASAFTQFDHATSGCRSLIHKCVTGVLRVPDFEMLTEVIDKIFDQVEPNKDGENAQYIPQLAEVDPEQFSVSFTTVDGQHYSRGDSDTQVRAPSRGPPREPAAVGARAVSASTPAPPARARAPAPPPPSPAARAPLPPPAPRRSRPPSRPARPRRRPLRPPHPPASSLSAPVLHPVVLEADLVPHRAQAVRPGLRPPPRRHRGLGQQVQRDGAQERARGGRAQPTDPVRRRAARSRAPTPPPAAARRSQPLSHALSGTTR